MRILLHVRNPWPRDALRFGEYGQAVLSSEYYGVGIGRAKHDTSELFASIRARSLKRAKVTNTLAQQLQTKSALATDESVASRIFALARATSFCRVEFLAECDLRLTHLGTHSVERFGEIVVYSQFVVEFVEPVVARLKKPFPKQSVLLGSPPRGSNPRRVDRANFHFVIP
jgi:hypothetical protein